MKTPRIYLLLTLLNLSALFLFAFKSQQDTFDRIRVREFELVDEKGQNRVSIKVEPDGELVFRMKDEAGTIRVKMGAGKDGSGLLLLNGETEPGLHALAKRGKTSLTLTNADGSKREF